MLRFLYQIQMWFKWHGLSHKSQKGKGSNRRSTQTEVCNTLLLAAIWCSLGLTLMLLTMDSFRHYRILQAPRDTCKFRHWIVELVINLTEKLIVVFPLPYSPAASKLCASLHSRGLPTDLPFPWSSVPRSASSPRWSVGNVLAWLWSKWSALLFPGRCPRRTGSEPVQPRGSLPLRALAELQLRQPAVQDLR